MQVENFDFSESFFGSGAVKSSKKILGQKYLSENVA